MCYLRKFDAVCECVQVYVYPFGFDERIIPPPFDVCVTLFNGYGKMLNSIDVYCINRVFTTFLRKSMYFVGEIRKKDHYALFLKLSLEQNVPTLSMVLSSTEFIMCNRVRCDLIRWNCGCIKTFVPQPNAFTLLCDMPL